MAPVKDEKCAITGKPAKYRDPLTGLPYADLAAFKAIREQHTSAAAAVDRELDISHQEDMKRKHEAAAGQDSKRVRHGDDDADQQDKSNGRDDDGGLALSSNDCQAIRASDEVRAMLRDGEIREIIKRVDSAEDRAGALREMRSAHPEFEKLMLRILSVISEDAVDA